MLGSQNKGKNDLSTLDNNSHSFGADADDVTQSGVVDQNENNERSGKTGNELDESDLENDEAMDTEDFSDDVDADEEASKNPEVAGTDKAKQTPEENEVYKKIRQKAIADAMKEIDKEKEKVQTERQQIEHYNIRKKHMDAVTIEQIDKLAYEKGWPEDAARQVLMDNAIKVADQEIGNNLRNEQMLKLQKEAYKSKPYFSLVEPQIDSFMKSNPGVDMEGVYKYFLGEIASSGKMDEIIKKEKSHAQKATIADIQDRARRRGISGGDGGKSGDIDPSTVMSKKDIEMALAFGNDPKEIAKMVAGKLKDKKRR